MSLHDHDVLGKRAIVVRTLNTVGGIRPGRKFTRKTERKVRSMGFHSIAHFTAALAAHPQLAQNIRSIARQIVARTSARGG
jgi:hypothetical protein